MSATIGAIAGTTAAATRAGADRHRVLPGSPVSNNAAMARMRFTDLSRYTVYDLYLAGTRFSVGYRPEDAVERFLELHPQVDPAAVAQELREAIEKQLW